MGSHNPASSFAMASETRCRIHNSAPGPAMASETERGVHNSVSGSATCMASETEGVHNSTNSYRSLSVNLGIDLNPTFF